MNWSKAHEGIPGGGACGVWKAARNHRKQVEPGDQAVEQSSVGYSVLRQMGRGAKWGSGQQCSTPSGPNRWDPHRVLDVSLDPP